MSPATWIISVRISGSISGYNHRWTEAHAINVNIKNVPSRISFTQSMASSPLSFLISINFNVLLLKQLILFSPDEPCIEDQKEAAIGMAISTTTNLVTTVEQCLNDYLEHEMGCLLPWCKLKDCDMSS